MQHRQQHISLGSLFSLVLLLHYTSSVQAIQNTSVLDYEGQYQYECTNIELTHHYFWGKVVATVPCKATLQEMYDGLLQACVTANMPSMHCNVLEQSLELDDTTPPLVPELLTGVNTFSLNVTLEDHPWVKMWGVYPTWFIDQEGNELFALLNNHDGVENNVKMELALPRWIYYFNPLLVFFQPKIDWKIDGSIDRNNNYSFSGFTHSSQLINMFGIHFGMEIRVNFSGARL